MLLYGLTRRGDADMARKQTKATRKAKPKAKPPTSPGISLDKIIEFKGLLQAILAISRASNHQEELVAALAIVAHLGLAGMRGNPTSAYAPRLTGLIAISEALNYAMSAPHSDPVRVMSALRRALAEFGKPFGTNPSSEV